MCIRDRDTDLKQFCEASKKYGVLYCVLKDRNADDGITDVMVRAEDASKINRIFERFQLATVDTVSYTHLDVYKRQPWYSRSTPLQRSID